jgi:mandelamide amidase
VRSWQRAHIALVQRMIGLAPGTGGTAGVAWLRSRVPSAPGASKPLPAPRRRRVHANPAAMSVAETLGAVAAGTSSAEDQARRCAIACAGDTLRAFTQVDAASALREARECDRRAREEHSPLRGVVLAVKDNIDAAGFATTAGTPALTGHRPHRDAPVVQALRAAGAVVVGKTNMHELAYGATSDNAVYGRVRHPVRPELIAGGSSGGSAAAVAGGLVTAALGTETGCSVRVPAALCGLVGFRPTTGAYPAAGVVPVSWTRDTVGLLARTVEDIRILDAVCRAQTHRAAFTAVLGRLRLAAPHQPFCSGMPAALRSVFEARLRELEDAGVEIVECELPEEAMPAAAASSLPIALYETPRGIERYLGAHGLTLRFPEIAAQVASPDVAELLQPIATRGIDEDAYHEALALHRERLRLLLHRFLADQNLNGLIVPSAPITAPRLIPGDRIELDGRPVAAFPLLVRNADISSILGWPAISLPAAHPGHALPFGIDLQFPTGADDDLLAAAAEIESVWNQEPS